MKSILKKIIIIISIVLLLFVGYGVDYLIAKSYEIEFIEVTRLDETPILDEFNNQIAADVGISNGKSEMNVKVLVTRNNKPVKDHVLYVKTNRNVIGRYTTNNEGIVEFKYRCYLSNKPEDIIISVDDESNSVFVYVPVCKSYTLKMIAINDGKDSSTVYTNDIFFEI